MQSDVIKKLKSKGFFELHPLKQIEFLRDYGFFNLDIDKRIKFLERIGMFYIDANDDPPTIPLEPDDTSLDYLKEKPINETKNKISNNWKYQFISNVISSGQLIIDGVEGMENALSVETGAIITVNHFHPFDTFSIEHVLNEAGSTKKLYKVIREGNFTNFPKGKFQLYFKYDNTLPLSQMPETMQMFEQSLKKILDRKDLVLVCPEQSMWMGYKKPKPMKYGAFKWATENDVPIIPTFITQRSVEGNEQVQAYTIHIGLPIYADHSLSPRDNICRMRDLNYTFCRETYERVYGIPLEYETVVHEDIPKYVLSTPEFERRAKSDLSKDEPDGFDR